MRNNNTFASAAAILSLLSIVTVANASPVIADFEDVGAANGERFHLDTLIHSGVTLTFSLDGFTDLPEIAQVGDTGPGTTNRLIGFLNTIDGRDTPSQSDPDSDPKTIVGPSPDVSQYFLTNTNRRDVNLSNYVVDFDQLVTGVSLLVYDFNSDGNNTDGMPGSDTVTLQGYNGGTLVATDSWTVPVGRAVDGVTVKLDLGGANIDRFIVDIGGADFGTGIDNITFTPVPEPSSYALLAIGAICLIGSRRKRSRR